MRHRVGMVTAAGVTGQRAAAHLHVIQLDLADDPAVRLATDLRV